MVLGIGDSLEVLVSADTSSFTAQMQAAKGRLDEFGDEATQAAGSATFLSGRLERVGDRLTSITGKATAASAGIATLSASTNGLNASVTLLGTSLSVTLIPALALLATTVFPLAAALGGLAAILGSIVGIGAVGVASALAVNFQQLKETALAVRDAILQAIQPVAEVFTPVLQDILRLLPDVIANLIPARSELQAFANNMEAFARAVFNALPPLVELAVELANRFLPVLTDLVQGAGSRLPGLIRELVSVFGEVLVILRPLATELADNADEFTNLGLTTLRVLVPALVRLVDVLGDVARFVNNLSRPVRQALIGFNLLLGVVAPLVTILSASGLLGVLTTLGSFLVSTVIPTVASLATTIGGGLVFAVSTFASVLGGVALSALTTIAGVISGPVILAIGALLAIIGTLALAWETNFLGFRDIAKSALNTVMNLFNDLVNLLTRGTLEKALTSTRRALKAFFTGEQQKGFQFLKDALKNLVSFWKSNFRTLVTVALDVFGTFVERSIEFGRKLRVTFKQIGNSIFNAFATAFEGIGGVVVTIFNGIVETITRALNTVISTVNDAIAAAQNAGLSVGIQQFDQLQAGEFTAEAPTVQRRTTNRGQIRRQQNINTNVEVSVSVTDEGKLKATVEDVSEETIRKRERRTNRLRDRGSSV